MMHVARVAACVVAVATVTWWRGAAAQRSTFTCEDFLTQTAAQHALEANPRDPYDLDPDGDGIACEDMRTTSDADTGTAPDATAVAESPDATNDGAGAGIDVPQVPSQSTQAGVNTEERTYLDEIQGILQPVGDRLRRVGERFHVPRLVAERWISAVGLQVVLWQSSLADAVALQPPPAFTAIHSFYAGCLSLMVGASDDIAGGLETREVALANEAEATAGQAHEVIDQARGLIEALVSKRGG